MNDLASKAALEGGARSTPSAIATPRILERAVGIAFLAGGFGLCALLGFWIAFASFKPWDDEGYFLLALREYREHGGLYETIRTYYGPFYFQLVDTLFAALGRPVDAQGARWLLVAAWLAAVASVAYAAWRLERSVLAAALAAALGFPFLAVWTNEPLHPTTPILLCLAPLLVLLVGPLGRGGRPSVPALAACGALCAAILLIKSNVGVFVSLAVLAALAPRFAFRAAPVLRAALALALVVLPFALMRPLLDLDWALDFALLVAISAAPFGLELLRSRAGDWGGREARALAAGFAGLAAVSLALCLANGTTFAGLRQSLVLDALAFPLRSHASPPLPERGRILLSALVIPLAFALRPSSPALVALRLGAGIHLVCAGLVMETPFGSLPFVFLTATGTRSHARIAIGLLAVLTSLQAFPIAGCQVGLFALLAMLAGATGACDSLRRLPVLATLPGPVRRLGVAAIAIAVALLLARENPVWRSIGHNHLYWTRQQVPLDLSGTGALRLDELEVARFRWLAANLRHNADTFVGVPGLHSLYPWSGLEPPVPFYSHNWQRLRYPAEERGLVRALLESPRPAVVRNESIAGYWQDQASADGPVERAIAAGFVRAGAVGGYELMFPRAARPELLLSATALVGRDDLLVRHGAAHAFVLAFPPLGGARIGRLVLRDAATGIDRLDTAAPNADRRLVVTTLDGDELHLGTETALVDPGRRFLVVMLWPPIALEHGADKLVVRAFDTEGRIVARLLFPGGAEAP